MIIGNVDLPIWTHYYTYWLTEFQLSIPLRTPFEQKRAAAVEFLNIMSFRVAHIKISLWINDQSLRPLELTIFRSLTAPLAEELTLAGELLNPMVKSIRDVNIAQGIDGHASKSTKVVHKVKLAFLMSWTGCGSTGWHRWYGAACTDKQDDHQDETWM